MDILCAKDNMKTVFLVRFRDGAMRWVARDLLTHSFSEIELNRAITWQQYQNLGATNEST